MTTLDTLARSSANAIHTSVLDVQVPTGGIAGPAQAAADLQGKYRGLSEPAHLGRDRVSGGGCPQDGDRFQHLHDPVSSAAGEEERR